MIITRTLASVALGLVLATHSPHAQGRPQYRDFQLGADLLSVSALAKATDSGVKTIHVRPALIQQVEWRRPYFVSESSANQDDPVEQIVFNFYNDQLFRLVISYDRQRTSGMTDADLTDAISLQYGAPLKPGVKGVPSVVSQVDAEFSTPVARWGGADYSVVLYRRSYASEYRVIVTSPSLDALARTAAAQAIRLDEREAPQREVARQKKEVEDAQVSQEKVRVTNKAAFRP